MQNDPELSGKYLGKISADFIKVADTLKESSYQIRKAGFQMPVFPMCQEDQPIGTLLIEPGQLENEWRYYASLLEEFLQRGLIDPAGQEAFESTYKNPDEFCCLFVVDKSFTNFVYIPYPED